MKNNRTSGELIVQSLIAHGIDTLFGLPGVQNDWLYKALYDARDKIRVIHTRHEQGAGYMALGYALARGGIGVFNVVPGPGFLNAGAALATGYALNAQLLCLAGQIPSGKIGVGSGALHEIPNQLAMMRGLTKWAARIESAEEASPLVAEAIRQMRSGRPRPVGLETPMDVLPASTPNIAIVPPLPASYPQVDETQIEAAGKALGASRAPLIFVGSGAQGISQQVTQLAEMLQAPVIAYRTGQGVLDGRHYLSLHLPAAHTLWGKADVVLAIGSHMRIPLSGWGADDQLAIIRIDVDPAAHHIVPPQLQITARAEDALPLLLEATARHNRRRPSRQEEIGQVKSAWRRQTAYLQPQRSYLQLIREELGEEGVFVDELTQVGYASRILMPVYKPRTFISTGYQGTLGYGFPTALGVKVAKPDTPVLSITGDGGFLFAATELATAVQHKIPLVTLLFNNNSYGNVQQMQKNLYGNRVIATDLVNPDFVKLAESFGAGAFRAETMEELRRAIREGFAADLPTLIEIPIGETPTVDRFRALGRVR